MTRPFAALLASALLLVVAPVGRVSAAPALQGLSTEDVDPVRLLPPPPADGSPRQKAELDELRAIQAGRTDARLATAQWDAVHEDVRLFAPVLGLKFDLAALPETAKLVAIVDNDQEIAAKAAKKAFHRHRPWTFDPTLVGCPRGDKPDPLTSYPSGHATTGYALGVFLAGLMPDRAADILGRASDYADSRLVCEAHFRSDVAAGQTLGTAVALMELKSPALQPQIAAAKAELKAAGL